MSLRFRKKSKVVLLSMKIRPFLSHKRENAASVARLRDMLCVYGAGGWKDTDDLRVGVHTEAGLRQAILEDTGGFIWWGTRKALQSETINGLEIPMAFERAKQASHYPLVPVFVGLRPGRDRDKIAEAVGDLATDFLIQNGFVKSATESAMLFRQRVARRYVRDALGSVVGDTAHIAFRAMSEPGGEYDITFDWRGVIDDRSRNFQSDSLALLQDALANVREVLQSNARSPQFRITSDLPLPLAWLVGYEWRITTGVRLEFYQRTGAAFDWIPAEGPVAELPIPRSEIINLNGPVVIVVSCRNSLKAPAYRYATKISASEIITIHKPGILRHDEIRALARTAANELGVVNDRGLSKHLLMRGPASMAAMIGAASNASGPVTIPFWNGTEYVSPVTVS